MRMVKNILRWGIACAAVVLMTACDEEARLNKQMQENLTSGYWTSVDQELLVRFFASGEMQYFRFVRTAGNDAVDAWRDPSMQPHTEYAVDFLNNYLCLLPDTWYNILSLTEDALTLQAAGADPVFCVKVPASHVTLLSEEEFRAKYPAES